MPAGRKSLREEIGVLKRYSDLSVPYFKFLKDTIEGDDKDEKKWAIEDHTHRCSKPMTYEHDKCSGEVEIIFDGYALCMLCGDEGEYVAVDNF